MSHAVSGSDRSITFSFHRGVLETIKLTETPRRVLITGGTGLGKSAVLREIAAALQEPRIIAGREPSAIAELHDAMPTGKAILVDDVDRLFDPSIEDLLARLRNEPHRRVIFTSTLPADASFIAERNVRGYAGWSKDKLRSWSLSMMEFHGEPLNPWTFEWRARVGAMLWEVLGSQHSGSHATALHEWTTAVVHLTGGHPALLNAAVVEMRRSYTDSASSSWLEPVSQAATVSRRRLIYRFLDEALFSAQAVRRIRSLVRELQEYAPAVMSALTRLDDPGDEMDCPVEVRRAVLDTGLAYVNPHSRRVSIAGELVRRSVTMGPARDPSVRCLGDSADGTGAIEVDIGGKLTRVAVRGAAWRILSRLYDARAQIVSVAELANAIGSDAAGVRAAIQRLKSDFLEAGLGGLVENVWGAGYQFIDFPLAMDSESEVDSARPKDL